MLTVSVPPPALRKFASAPHLFAFLALQQLLPPVPGLRLSALLQRQAISACPLHVSPLVKPLSAFSFWHWSPARLTRWIAAVLASKLVLLGQVLWLFSALQSTDGAGAELALVA